MSFESLEMALGGKYRVTAQIGRGGMGEVYKARHIHLESDCVIKIMRPQLGGLPGLDERFLREARAARRIHHPNVATLYDLAQIRDGSFYMVWEFIDGVTLASLLREGQPLLTETIVDITLQTLDGLEAIHRAGFVHRDISPDNLMIVRGDDGQTRVKIIDLGIAKPESESGDTLTATGMFLGKLKYASPEQLGAIGPDERIDGRADLYSLGVVLYEMLTGHVPFTGSTPQQCIAKHLFETPPPMNVDSPLVPLIERALAKNRTDRFASAGEFSAALQLTVTTPVPVRSQKGKPRAALIVLVVLVVASLVGLWVVQRDFTSKDAFFGSDHPEFPRPADRSTLRFNHALHLRAGGIFNETGQREHLTCSGCHGNPARLSFEQHCQRCHALTFDARIPTAQLPHGGDPDLVYGYISSLENSERPLAEQVIKTKCSKCHEMRREGTRLVATPPELRTRWFEGVKFTHTPHTAACITCHAQAPNSTLTSDVSMPVRADCMTCHGKPETKLARCETCHVPQPETSARNRRGGSGSPGRGT